MRLILRDAARERDSSACRWACSASEQLFAQLRSYLRKYVAKHLWRQHARIGVVARAVIAVVKFGGADLMHGAMRKRRRGGPQAQRLQRRFMRDPAERHDRAQSRHGLDGRNEELAADVDFGRL